MRHGPGATIAFLFQKDDYGTDLLVGLKRGLQQVQAKVIEAQPYRPAHLGRRQRADDEAKASGADTPRARRRPP